MASFQATGYACLAGSGAIFGFPALSTRKLLAEPTDRNFHTSLEFEQLMRQASQNAASRKSAAGR